MRLFIAINLPENIKEVVERMVNDLKISINQLNQHKSAAEIRFLPKENWHLTITFLGYQPDEAVSLILKPIQETAADFDPVLIKFEKIIYGPPGKPARMLWLAGAEKTSRNLGEIKEKLENELIKNKVNFRQENRQFHTHLTLARFQYEEVELPKKVPLPKIDCCFEAKTLDLMESRLKRTGAEYESISRFAFRSSVL